MQPVLAPFALCLVRPSQVLGAESYFHDLIAGIEEVTLAEGYSVLLRVLPTMEDEEHLIRHWARNHSVSGLFLVDLRCDDPRPALAREVGLPVVASGPPQDDFTTTLWTDDDVAMTRAVEFLASRGHRAIFHVGGEPSMAHSTVRREAFDKACEELGIEGFGVSRDYSKASGHAAVLEAFDLGIDATAAIFDSDLMALGGIEACRELGLSVPGDLSILGWNDSVQAQLSTPPLSAVARDVRGDGRLMGRAMLEVLNSASQGVIHSSPSTIIERATTGF